MKYLPSSIKIYHTPPPPPPPKEWDNTENYLPSILGKLNPSTMQTWAHACDTDFSTPQLSETDHIKNLYLHHRDIFVADKIGPININGNNMTNN